MRDDQLGPVATVVAELPAGGLAGRGLKALLEAVDAGSIRVLDLEFVAKDADGTVHLVPLGEITPDGADLSVWEGASSGLLDESDVHQAGSELAPGGVAVVLVYEHVWAVSLVEELGARLVSAAGVSPDELVAALDATDPS